MTPDTAQVGMVRNIFMPFFLLLLGNSSSMRRRSP